ncbi:MAG: NAD+ synthase [Bacteroidia bacterium]
MKIALAQLNYHIGNFEKNVFKIKNTIQQAKLGKVDLIVFSELSACGYPPKDLLEYTHFIQQCENAVMEIAKQCVGISAIVGAPSANKNAHEKKIFNAAFFLENGEIKSIHAKTLLPDYDVFDECRHFEQNKKWDVVHFKNHKIALTICEDLWYDENPLYTVNPMDELMKHNPDFIVNIAASPFSTTHAEIRKSVITKAVKKYKLPLFYVNQVGAQTDLIFDGGSMVISNDGKPFDELNSFSEDFKIYEISSDKEELKKISEEKTLQKNNFSKAEKIQSALVLGIRDYFEKNNFKTAIVGLSGGIDSAVVLALACEALGGKNIFSVLMPSKFSSDHSVADALEMVKNIGCHHQLISIDNTFDTLEKTMQPHFENRPFNLAEENMQARIRGIMLMALSNKFGHILLNTSNKSEMAVGYGTLYGDMCGALSVIGDVYKTEVYELAHTINSTKKVIPKNIFSKAPSAELRHDQKDSDSLPDYEILDKILFQYIEKKQSEKEIISSGFDILLIKKIIQMINNNEYKRHQTPPVLRVSDKAFGTGRKMPIVGKY